MSGNAAQEISGLLEASVTRVDQMIESTRTAVEALVADGKREVKIGVDVAQQCGALLNEIVTNVGNVSVVAAEISGASVEQSQGIGEINKAMTQLDHVTQENAAASEETAAAATQLSGQADALRFAVVQLLSLVEGEATHQETPRFPSGVAAATSTPPARTTVTARSPRGAGATAKVIPLPPRTPDTETHVHEGVPSYDHPAFKDV